MLSRFHITSVLRTDGQNCYIISCVSVLTRDKKSRAAWVNGVLKGTGIERTRRILFKLFEQQFKRWHHSTSMCALYASWFSSRLRRYINYLLTYLLICARHYFFVFFLLILKINITSNLLNPHQSAYCKHHSTETALCYINDLINAIGSQKSPLSVVLISLQTLIPSTTIF